MTRVYSREEVRAIPIHTRKTIGGIVTGEARARPRGAQGLEFADFREYEPGDDVSRIDWNVTARLGKPWVRTYLEERGHPMLLLVDVSASTECGRGELPPRNVIADMAARLASAAIWSGCQTGLLLFGNRVRKYMPAAAGISQLTTIVRELKRALPDCGETDVAGALDYLQTVRQRRGLVFLLSDFLCGDFAPSLRRCAARHEIVAIGVTDSSATDAIPDCGLVNLRDPETGCFRQIDTASPEVRSAFDNMRRTQSEHNADSFRKSRIDYLQITSGPHYMNSVVAFLRQRAG